MLKKVFKLEITFSSLLFWITSILSCIFIQNLFAQNTTDISTNDFRLEEKTSLSFKYFASIPLDSHEEETFLKLVLSTWNQIFKSQSQGDDFQEIFSQDNRFKIKLYYDSKFSPYLKIFDSLKNEILYHGFYDDFDYSELKNFSIKKYHLTFSKDIVEKNIEQFDFLKNKNIKFFKKQKSLIELQEKLFKKSFKIAKNEIESVLEIIPTLLNKLSDLQNENLHLTEQEFIKTFIQKDQVRVRLGEVLGEVNAVNGKIFLRIVDQNTERAFLFFLKKDYHPESELQKLYIARQRVLAGEDRRDKKFGRDLFLIVLDEENFRVLNSEDIFSASEAYWFPRHELGLNGKNLKALVTNPLEYSKSFYDWGKDYTRSVYSSPNLSTVTFGIAAGLTQSFLNVGTILTFHALSKLTGLELNVKNLSDFNVLLSTTILPFLWGAPIGIMIKTYKNFITHGTLLSRFLKNATNSIGFYLLLSLLTRGPEHIANFYFITGMLFTITTQNFSKPLLLEIPKMREKASLNKETLNIWGDTIKWERSDIENQFAYLPLFIIKQIDILGLAPFGIPLGKALVSLSFPFALWLSTYTTELMGRVYPHNTKIQDALITSQARWKHFKWAFKSLTVLKLTLEKEIYLWAKELITNHDYSQTKISLDNQILEYIKKQEYLEQYPILRPLDEINSLSSFEKTLANAFKISESTLKHLKLALKDPSFAYLLLKKEIFSVLDHTAKDDLKTLISQYETSQLAQSFNLDSQTNHQNKFTRFDKFFLKIFGIPVPTNGDTRRIRMKQIKEIDELHSYNDKQWPIEKRNEDSTHSTFYQACSEKISHLLALTTTGLKR